MHTSLMLSSMLLIALGGSLALGVLPRLSQWQGRRRVQLLILGIPLIALVLTIGAFQHFSNQDCFLSAPGWDYLLGTLMPLGFGLVALSSFAFGLLRVLLMRRVVIGVGLPINPQLQMLANRQADRLGIACPRLLVRFLNQPLALTYGFWRPTVLLSTWMIEHLDEHELEAVLTHEFGHIVRQDYLAVCIANTLRDAFFYLPASWKAFRQFQHEKELACDDLVVAVTRRPLALASALAKVWQQTANPPFGMAQSFAAFDRLMAIRIDRLLTAPKADVDHPESSSAPWLYTIATITAILILEAINMTVLMVPMGCGPANLLRKMF